MKFVNTKNMVWLDLMVYSDAEVFWSPCQKAVGNSEVVGENRRLASIGYHAVCSSVSLPDEFQNRMFVDVGDGKDPFTEYMRSLFKLLLFWNELRENALKLAMKAEDWRKFNMAEVCELCGKRFKSCPLNTSDASDQ